jgi:CxxC-x17-CxxC domain-containing protein
MTYFNRDDRNSFGPRRDFGGSRGGQDRRMYPAVCDECGRDCQVPFAPDGSKPIYCSNCFEKNQRGADQKRPSFGGRQFEDRKGGQSPSQSQTQNNELLVSINAKLGKILDILNASNKPAQKEPVVEETPVKKVKKVAKKKETV